MFVESRILQGREQCNAVCREAVCVCSTVYPILCIIIIIAGFCYAIESKVFDLLVEAVSKLFR